MIRIQDKEFEVFISGEEILKRVKSIAEALSDEYKEETPLFVVLLNGAFLFASDLLKEFSGTCDISFIKVASYSGTSSTGEVTELLGLTEDISGRHVVVLDDIIDTGLTMKYVLDRINESGPSSVRVVSLLFKPDSFKKEFRVDYTGFTIPATFVAGYGLDYDGKGRNLKDIYSLKD